MANKRRRLKDGQFSLPLTASNSVFSLISLQRPLGTKVPGHVTTLSELKFLIEQMTQGRIPDELELPEILRRHAKSTPSQAKRKPSAPVEGSAKQENTEGPVNPVGTPACQGGKSAVANPAAPPAPMESPVNQAKTGGDVTPVETPRCQGEESAAVPSPQERAPDESSWAGSDGASLVIGGLQCARVILDNYRGGQGAAEAIFRGTAPVAGERALEFLGRSAGGIIGRAFPQLGEKNGEMIGAFVGETVSAVVVERVAAWLFPANQQQQQHQPEEQQQQEQQQQ